MEGGTVSFSVNRTAGTFYDVSVDWSVSPQVLLAPPFSGTVFFAAGQSWAQIDITAALNSLPSLPQVFSVQLSNVQGGAILGPNAVESFTLGSNDAPYGVFQLAANPVLSVLANGFVRFDHL